MPTFWEDWLCELEAMPADSPEWDAGEGFLDRVRQVIRQKREDLETPFREALSHLAEHFVTEITFFGIGVVSNLSPKQYARASWPEAKKLVEQLHEQLLEHRRTDSTKGVNSTEEKARRARLDTIDEAVNRFSSSLLAMRTSGELSQLQPQAPTTTIAASPPLQPLDDLPSTGLAVPQSLGVSPLSESPERGISPSAGGDSPATEAGSARKEVEATEKPQELPRKMAEVLKGMRKKYTDLQDPEFALESADRALVVPFSRHTQKSPRSLTRRPADKDPSFDRAVSSAKDTPQPPLPLAESPAPLPPSVAPSLAIREPQQPLGAEATAPLPAIPAKPDKPTTPLEAAEQLRPQELAEPPTPLPPAEAATRVAAEAAPAPAATQTPLPATPAIDGFKTATSPKASGQSVFWQYVQEGDLPGAYWLCRSLEAAGSECPVPSWLIAAVQGARWQPSENCAMAEDLLGIAAEHEIPEGLVCRLLALAAAIHPTLTAPTTGLATWLEMLYPLENLRELVAAVQSFATHGRKLRPEDTKGRKGRPQAEKELSATVQTAKGWLADSADRRTDLRRANRLWSQLVRPGGLVYKMIQPVMTDSRSQIDEVRQTLAGLERVEDVVRHIHELDMENHGQQIQPMKAAHRDQLVNWVFEASNLAGAGATCWIAWIG